ncbi:MAG: hypothetical protein IJ496_02015 [Ruminococcus sp.]|nr:hypothetical protein [Ruminococcus sp.]
MDLRQFYLDNVKPDEYYYRFYDLISNVNMTYNIFGGEQETEHFDFQVFDMEEAIAYFKKSCQPENDSSNKEYDSWFYLTLFYMFKLGYVIEEFPTLVERPPKERTDFTYSEIRNRIIEMGQDENGTVRYATRRVFISKMTFVQKDTAIILDETIEMKFREISNRHASFEKMSTDEKLAEIANLIENMLKKNDKFLALDYSTICFDFIDDNTIKRFRKQLHIFRHSSEEALLQRKNYSNEQKSFMVDYGLTIIKAIHTLTTQ